MKKTILLLLIFISGKISAQTFPVTTILYNGPSSNHFDLVFLADGFTATEQTNFITQVNNITTTIFSTAPYNAYKNLFNVYAIQVNSTSSGILHQVAAPDCAAANPNVPASATTSYFGSKFDYGSIHRLVVATNTTAIQNVLLANFPAYNKAIVVANSTYYGGSGGTYPCCTINNASAEIVIHELGHSIANLTDEYTSGGCSTIEKPNCTMETNPTLIKWKAWIPGGMPIPTPSSTNCTSVGLYLGANYCPTTWYRPMCNCKMLALGQPFCSICKEELIVSFLNMTNLINSYSPVNTATINIAGGGSQTFSSTIIQTIPNTVKSQWVLDGTVVATNNLSYTAIGNNLANGNHTLTFNAWDTTSLVKKLVPTNSVSWTINKSGTTPVTLSAFNAVCLNASSFILTGGSPTGGTYSGTGVSAGIFNPASAGVGTFTITYTYNSQSASQTIQVKALPVISLSPSSSSICSGTATTITASGATSYSWSPSTALSSTSLASTTASPTSSITYTITGTSNGCSSSATCNVIVIALPTLNISGSNAICNGSSTTLSASGATTYSWSPSTGLNLTSGSTVIANPTTSTTYSITGTANGCTKTQTFSLAVNSIPIITSSANATICSGTSTTLTASGANTYTWSPSTALNVTTGSSVIANPISNITYTITGSNGCSSTKTVSVSVNSVPTISSSVNTTICSGTSTTMTASGATTYSWSPSNGLNLTSGSSVIAAPLSTTTYTITGTTNGCSNTKTISVSVNATPTLTTSGNTTICSGSSTPLTVSGATTYSWSPSIGLSATTGSSVIANPSTNNTYTIIGSSNGCNNTKTISVSVNAVPAISSSSNTTICSGNSTTLTASGASTYSWAPSSGLNLTSGASVIATPTSSTTYTITGTTNSCLNTKTISVTINPTPVISSSANTSICNGSYTVLTASGATTYSWSPSTAINITTGASVNANPVSSTTYTVIGITNGCSSSKTISVTVSSNLVLNVSGTTTICSGNSTSLTVSGATTYTWSPSTALNATTGAAVSSTPISNITYTISGNSGTCSATTSVAIIVNATPTITVSGNASTCSGTGVSLFASGASTYNWSPSTGLNLTSGSSVIANPISSITYSITGSAANGCTKTSSKIITVNALPSITYTATNPTNNQSNGAINITVSGGQAPYAFLWSNGVTNEDLNSVAAGTFTCTITSSTGCIKTQSVTLTNTGTSCNVTSGASFMSTNSTSTIVMWGSVTGAYKYNLRTRPVGSTLWTLQTTNGANTAATISGLLSSTQYEVQIQTQCDAAGSNLSAFSVSYYFTTSGSARFEKSDDEHNLDFDLFPNPTTDNIHLEFSNSSVAAIEIRIYDMTGREMKIESFEKGQTELVILLQDFPQGLYSLVISGQNLREVRKVLKQ